jgi:hypothetical protein
MTWETEILHASKHSADELKVHLDMLTLIVKRRIFAQLDDWLVVDENSGEDVVLPDQVLQRPVKPHSLAMPPPSQQRT